ncbi:MULTISPECIES: carbohydrate ABC transporter permease [unclassified Blautia]|uniref:carbohydrate ABC transporter permease n=1 Tax=unclassified Blautia TaxID=2648079 RepID=UPI003F8ADCA0
MYKKPSLPKQFLIYIGMTVVALIFMFPLIWMIVSSFKDDAMIFSDITSLKAFVPAFKEDVFFNYKEVISKLPLVKAMLNSLSYIIVIIALGLIVNSMAGYAFARLKFPKKNLLFALIVPLAKPVYATVGILVFIACWNDFVWPVMVISDSSKQTIQMALSSLFSIQPVNYGNVMAGLTLVTIPVLIIFLSLQKYYVAGIASTGAKN